MLSESNKTQMLFWEEGGKIKEMSILYPSVPTHNNILLLLLAKYIGSLSSRLFEVDYFFMLNSVTTNDKFLLANRHNP